MANILEAQSAEFEGAGTGIWSSWFGCTIAKSTEAAHAGSGSLRVESTGGSLGVTNDNWPGSPGVTSDQEYEISWAAEGPARTFTLSASWRDDGGTVLGSASVPLTTAGAGVWVVSDPVRVTPPAGTTRYYLEVTASSSTGEVYHFDSFTIDDEPGGAAPEVHEFTAAVSLTLSTEVEQSKTSGLSAALGVSTEADAGQSKAAEIAADLDTLLTAASTLAKTALISAEALSALSTVAALASDAAKAVRGLLTAEATTDVVTVDANIETLVTITESPITVQLEE